VATVRACLIDRLSPEQVRQLGDIGAVVISALSVADTD
jgi:hypothetical protein